MSINIEALFTDINGTTPDRKTIQKIKQAGLQLKLKDYDAFWLVLIVFEGQQSEVAKAMSATSNLADTIKTAAADASTTAAAIRKILKEGAPWLAKAIQDAALGVSGELTGAIGHAAEKCATAIVTATEGAAADAGYGVACGLEKAGRQAAEQVRGAASAAIYALGEALNELRNEAKLAGTRTLMNWTDAVDAAVEKQMIRRSETEMVLQRQRTFQTIIITLLVTLAGFISTGIIENRMGYRTGYAEGEQSNFDASVRAAWGNTKEGQEAYLLGLSGSIQVLAECGKPGWQIEDLKTYRMCYPKMSEKGLYGWTIP